MVSWGRYQLVLTLITCLSYAEAGHLDKPHSHHTSFTRTSLERTLDAIERLLRYLDRNRGSLIVDALWGIRMVEGGLKDALESTTPNTEPGLVERIRGLREAAGEVAQRGLYYAHRNSKVQFGKFSELLKRPWVYQNLVGGLARVDPDLVFGRMSTLNILPRESDYCLMGIIGSGFYEGNSCTITDKCWKQITDLGQRDYSITHQLLFFFLIRDFNCSAALEHRGGRDEVIRIVSTFCTNIFIEMEQILERGVLPGIEQDLIMEQVTFCGAAGFVEDFVRPDILPMILEWQRDDGCFAPYDGSHLSEAIALYKKSGNRTAVDPLKAGLEILNRANFKLREAESLPELHMPGRRLMSEAELRDGCMMHMSSVAGGAMSVYVSAIIYYNLYTDHDGFLRPRLRYYAGLEGSAYQGLVGGCLLLALLFLAGSFCQRPLKRLLYSLSTYCYVG